MVTGADLLNALLDAFEWLRNAHHYGVNWQPITAKQVPFSSFTAKQVEEMITAMKAVPLEAYEDILSSVKGFGVLQPHKVPPSIRPVFEPLFNAVINKEKLPPLKYPSRVERRAQLATKKFMIQFDFKAWFDQIALEKDVQNYYVFRIKEAVEIDGVAHRLFKLTREPMGSTHSAHVAQTITWAILEPLLRDKDVTVFTMIDNVMIAADDAETFVKAVRTFLQRAAQVDATINDMEDFPKTDEEIAALGAQNATGPYVFLGEEYVNGKVRNTQKNIEKLQSAFQQLQSALEGDKKVTKRNVAALIGLANWMALTVQIPLSEHFEVMRYFSKLSASPTKWDEIHIPTASFVSNINRLVSPLIKNEPTVPWSPPMPCESEYDTVIIVDACKDGYGAYVQMNKEIYQVQGGFRSEVRHSAWAEPIGATEILQWCRKKSTTGLGRVALITDHFAMAGGQRRPGKGTGGFSGAFHLNQFFKCAYQERNGVIDIFYVEGPNNPADVLSREVPRSAPITARRVYDRTLPPVESFFHPYLNQPTRPWWCV